MKRKPFGEWIPALLRPGALLVMLGLAVGCGPSDAGPPTHEFTPVKHEDRDSPAKWGMAKDGLRAGLVQHEKGTLTLMLENVSKDSIKIWSHVEAREKHYDWFRIHAKSVQNGSMGEFLLLDARDLSVPVGQTLQTGGQLVHNVDFQAWSKRKINGGKGLLKGQYELWFTFEVRDPGVWNGRVESGSVMAEVGENGIFGN